MITPIIPSHSDEYKAIPFSIPLVIVIFHEYKGDNGDKGEQPDPCKHWYLSMVIVPVKQAGN